MRKLFKYLLLFVSIIFYSTTLTAQNNKEYKTNLKHANEQFSYENYNLALPMFRELYMQDSTNIEVNYKYGICIYNILSKEKAVPYLEKSKNNYIDAYFYLARIYHYLEKFNKALDYYKFYLNSTKEKHFTPKDVEFYKAKTLTAQLLQRKPVNVIVKNLGKTINTGYPEYAPLVTSDQNTLLFTSRRKGSTGNLKDPNYQYFEDIYISNFDKGKWQQPKNIGAPINTATHDAAVAITRDGKILYIYRTSKDLTTGDLYISKLINGKWTEPEKLSSDINSKTGTETSACLSPDERTLYFSSSREGGFGGKDIYVAKKLPNNKWSLATNLGSIINTPYDDDAPFVNADGTKLYFCSRGHENIGGYDIFVSDIKDDGSFSPPKNIGYPVNSVADDIYFYQTVDGNKSYFSSNRTGGYGKMDIYIINALEKNKQNLILKGIIYTNDPTYKTLDASITILDYDTKEIQGIYRTNHETGKYIMVLQPRKKYKMVVEADGYQSFVSEIDMTKKLRFEDLFKNIDLKLEK